MPLGSKLRYASLTPPCGSSITLSACFANTDPTNLNAPNISMATLAFTASILIALSFRSAWSGRYAICKKNDPQKAYPRLPRRPSLRNELPNAGGQDDAALLGRVQRTFGLGRGHRSTIIPSHGHGHRMDSNRRSPHQTSSFSRAPDGESQGRPKGSGARPARRTPLDRPGHSRSVRQTASSQKGAIEAAWGGREKPFSLPETMRS